MFSEQSPHNMSNGDSLHSAGFIEDSFDNARSSCHQIELPLIIKESSEPKISLIISKLDQQQQSLEELTKGFIEVVVILHEQQELNPREAIEAVKQEVTTLSQGVTALGQGVWKIYQHLEKDSIGKELKSGQQNLQKAIEANSQKKTTANIGYLDWKQIATIITATAIVSSLCSLAVFQIAANWKTDRTPTPTEKPLKPKKTTK